MKRLLIFLLVLVTFTLPLSGCGYSEAELTEARSTAHDDGYDTGYTKGYDEGRAGVLALEATPEATVTLHDDYYSKHIFIRTIDIPSASIVLAKGEVFEAYITIGKARNQGRVLVSPPTYGSIVFWIWGPGYHKVFDAGRIEGQYKFRFTVEESGTYILVFDDTEEKCFLWIDYKSSANLSLRSPGVFINPYDVEPNPFEPPPPVITVK